MMNFIKQLIYFPFVVIRWIVKHILIIIWTILGLIVVGFFTAIGQELFAFLMDNLKSFMD